MAGDAPEVTNAADKVQALSVKDASPKSGKKKKGGAKKQTNPPTIPIAELYPDGKYTIISHNYLLELPIVGFNSKILGTLTVNQSFY